MTGEKILSYIVGAYVSEVLGDNFKINIKEISGNYYILLTVDKKTVNNLVKKYKKTKEKILSIGKKWG